jgi:hypothetical protein
MARISRLAQFFLIALGLLVAPIASLRPANAQLQGVILEAIVGGTVSALTEYAIKHAIENANAGTPGASGLGSASSERNYAMSAAAPVDRPSDGTPSDWEVVRGAYKTVADQNVGYVPPGLHVVHQDNVPSDWEVVRGAYKTVDDQNVGYVPPGLHVVHQDNVPSNWEVVRGAYKTVGD